jgi:hypothetical protein
MEKKKNFFNCRRAQFDKKFLSKILPYSKGFDRVNSHPFLHFHRIVLASMGFDP